MEASPGVGSARPRLSLRSVPTGLLYSLPMQMLMIAVVVRATLYFITWLSIKSLPPAWTAASMTIGAWTQWDADYYIAIAEVGYAGTIDRAAAFFPLYPLTMRSLSAISTLSVPVSGMVVAALCFFASVPITAQLSQEVLGTERARTASLLLILSPFAVFYTTVYTESLFMLLCVLALYLARKERWLLAAVAVAFATATRVTGLALLPAILFIVWRRTRSLKQVLTVALVSPLGIISYMMYLQLEFGDPLRFLAVQEEWGGYAERWGMFTDVFLTNPVELASGDHIYMIAFVNLILFGLSLSLLPLMIKRLPLEIVIFTGLVMFQGVTSLQSLGRYLLPAIGVYMALGILLTGNEPRRTLRSCALYTSAILMTLFTILHTHGKWII